MVRTLTNKPSVLVIDDEESMREGCRQTLEAEGYRVLELLSQAGVNLLAFSAVPMGPEQTRIVLFTDHVDELKRVAMDAHLSLNGPQRAFLVQGDDQLGALASIHRKIADANVSVFASWGVTDGKGGYGYVMYVRPERFEDAAQALGI